MTEEMPIKYTSWIVLLVIAAAIIITVIYTVYKSNQANRMLCDVLYWIPGMSKIVKLVGGCGVVS